MGGDKVVSLHVLWMCCNGEQLLLHRMSPSQVKRWERQGPAALSAANPPAHVASTTILLLKTLAWQQAVLATSQLSISGGLGSLCPCCHFQHCAHLHEAFGWTPTGSTCL